MKATIQRLAGLGLRITVALAFLAPLLTRLVIGLAFHDTGHGKLQDLDKVTAFFTETGIPFPHVNAVFISYLEFVGGICLMAGLLTRVFAGLLSCSMIVAILTADRHAFIEKFPHDLISDATVSFTFLLFLIWLVLYGPGPISIDKLLSKWLGIGAKSGEAT